MTEPKGSHPFAWGLSSLAAQHSGPQCGRQREGAPIKSPGHRQTQRHKCLYPTDDALWCRVTKAVPSGGLLHVLLVTEPQGTRRHPVQEPAEPGGSAPAHTDIQLLPQQAGMASILATAVINSKWVTPGGRLGALKSEVRTGSGCSACKRSSFHFHTRACVHIHREGEGKEREEMNYAPGRH